MMYLQFLCGLVLLVVTAEIMIRGAVGLATHFGMSPLLVGMTVVALGTSAPELVVALDAAINGTPAVATGNVVGSNIANVLLIVGAAALLTPIVRRPNGRKRDGLLLIFFTVLFLMVGRTGEIGFASGALLLLVFVVYMGVTIRQGMAVLSNGSDASGNTPDGSSDDVDDVLSSAPKNLWLAALATVGGLVGIAFGADLTVTGGVSIARTYGVSEEVIGLTLIAVGTSLPELAATVVAARRGHPDVALGNILGSNMFNMLAIAGITAMVTPLPVSASMIAFDLWVILATSVVVAPVLMGRLPMTRFAGFVFLLLYAGYLAAQGLGLSARLAG